MYNPNLYYPYNYGTPYAPQYMQAQQPQNTMVSNFGNNTNIIYVNGIDDAKNRQQPTNSVYMYRDNEKQIIYEKTVDAKGQFEVKTYAITATNTPQSQKPSEAVDLSAYAKKSDIEAIKGEIDGVKENLKKVILAGELAKLDKKAVKDNE